MALTRPDDWGTHRFLRPRSNINNTPTGTLRPRLHLSAERRGQWGPVSEAPPSRSTSPRLLGQGQRPHLLSGKDFSKLQLLGPALMLPSEKAV